MAAAGRRRWQPAQVTDNTASALRRRDVPLIASRCQHSRTQRSDPAISDSFGGSVRLVETTLADGRCRGYQDLVALNPERLTEPRCTEAVRRDVVRAARLFER